VIINGKKVKPPKYYDLQYEKLNPYEWEEVQQKRIDSAKKNFEDNTDARLVVKETIAKARLSLLKRSLA
jgi:hypothetical protein